MNYFFFLSDNSFKCYLQIPKFKNNGFQNLDIRLYKATINAGYWLIDDVNCDEDSDFYYVSSEEENHDDIFFLALPSEIKSKKINKLIDYNSYTNTVPDFRANLCMLNSQGGFSSYQSEYPYRMTLNRGSLVSSISTLLDKNVDDNFIFIKNIFHEPIKEHYFAYLVSKHEREVIKSYKIFSNSTNRISISNNDISPDHYIVAKGFLGVPVYLCQNSKGHMSLEHTHPPHSNIKGKNQFKLVSNLRNELLKIIS